MDETRILFPKPASESDSEPKAPAAVHRLRDKAQKLKGPRGKYRCRKCHELPCVCEDPKQATPAAAQPDKHPPAAPTALFNEKNSKRLLEASFGIPTVLTQCKLWALTEEEALELSKPAADVLNEFVAVDPRWVSLSILTVSLGSIVARKAVLYTAWKRAMQLQRIPNAHETKPPETASPEVRPETNGHDEKGPGPSVSMDMLQ
jgi:hypothetical protein